MNTPIFNACCNVTWDLLEVHVNGNDCKNVCFVYARNQDMWSLWLSNNTSSDSSRVSAKNSACATSVALENLPELEALLPAFIKWCAWLPPHVLDGIMFTAQWQLAPQVPSRPETKIYDFMGTCSKLIQLYTKPCLKLHSVELLNCTMQVFNATLNCIGCRTMFADNSLETISILMLGYRWVLFSNGYQQFLHLSDSQYVPSIFL